MFEQAVNSTLILLIEKIGKEAVLADKFYLAGGTALALQLGHRISVDLDFFSRTEFDDNFINQFILENKGKVLVSESKTFHAIFKNSKISFFYYPYPLLNPPLNYKGIKIASIDDIACMKLIAIAQRAEKKDFFDLYEILQNIDIKSLPQNLRKKFSSDQVNLFHILKSIFFFEEAEESLDPVSVSGANWEMVKQYILNHQDEITKAFSEQV